MRRIIASIATVILIGIGLTAIYIPPWKMTDPRKSLENNETLIELARVNCLEDSLPEDIALFGVMPDTNPMVDDTEHWQEYSNHLRRLYLARSTFAPKLISYGPETHPWAIGIYKDYETGIGALQSTEWQIVKDCENGIFLLKR